MGFISIKENLGIPKYRQIVASIEKAILDGTLKKGDKLPSVNGIRNKFSLSRDTALKAFNELKVRGIVQSVAGKGYYVKSENVEISQKVFLLFDELNSFKEDLYNSFLSSLGNDIQVDIYFHHFNFDMFSKLIYDNIGNYNYYVIMPANLKNTNKVIENLPQENVYILDQTHPELSQYSGIYQNFEKDMMAGLTNGITLLKKYLTLILLFQEEKQPQKMLKGFNEFCKMTKFDNEIISSLQNRIPKIGEVYMIPDDRNLILALKKIKEEKLKLGSEIGIISYNDTLLKEIVEGGITTISTDFNKMGERLAQMVCKKEQLKIENPSVLIVRNSL